MSIKTKAIFRGQDGSMGYKTNTEYTLVINHRGGELINISAPGTTGRYCEYESVISFLKNWDSIRVIGPKK